MIKLWGLESRREPGTMYYTLHRIGAETTACGMWKICEENLMTYRRDMANKGRALEDLVLWQLKLYEAQGISNIQKISTPWKVIRKGKSIVSAFPEGKSTLDFRGTVRGGIPVSFDCKESEEPMGLPLKYIQDHQIDYIRKALLLGEISFLLMWVKPLNRYYIVPGEEVIRLWDRWKANKGKRGFSRS